MKSKVIFLDIDGVLCSERSKHAYNGIPSPIAPWSWDKFDQTAIYLLRCVIALTGADVVLSSSWRKEVNIAALEYRLGFKLADVTSTELTESTRSHKIHNWLMEHPEVTTYAILDDDIAFTPEQQKYLCRTSSRNGFLLGHYDKLMEILGT